MTNNKMLVNEKQRSLGNFLVGRLLPFKEKRQVGPFTFIDHMGPSPIGEGRFLDIDQHPHIGLSTLTYLFEGEIEHKDSIGTKKVITPGDVGFMTAGKAITHSERTPQNLRNQETLLHGYQIWVALPKELEEMDPKFDFYTSDSLPQWKKDGLTIKLVAGNAFGKSAPLQGFSPLFMVDIKADSSGTLHLKDQLKGEVAFVIVNGSITEYGNKIGAGQMMISKTNEACRVELEEGTRLLLFGGEQLPEERFLLWNFVSSNKDKLKQAKSAWEEKMFPTIEGDDSYIPFPTTRF